MLELGLLDYLKQFLYPSIKVSLFSFSSVCFAVSERVPLTFMEVIVMGAAARCRLKGPVMRPRVILIGVDSVMVDCSVSSMGSWPGMSCS